MISICSKLMPGNWCKTTISEICAVNPTLNKPSVSDDLEVSFVPMPAVEAGTGAIDVSAIRKFSDVKKGYTPFQERDVLFAKITPCMENGKMAVVPALMNGLGFGSTEFHVLRAYDGLIPEYIYYFVSSGTFRHEAEANMSGAVGQRRVTTPYLVSCEFPLPPTNEQQRIVAKIEELFSELDKGIESLKTAQAQLKVYRQALLKHAFEGKLTAQWRADNPDKLESAEALLERIQRERAERYQQQLADWETGGKQGSKPKAPKPQPLLTTPDLKKLPELPKGWAWTKYGELIQSSQNGISKRKGEAGQEFIVLRLADIFEQSISLDAPRTIRLTEEETQNYALRKDELLCIRVNGSPDLVGRMILVSDDVGAAFCDHFIRFRLLNAVCSATYLRYFFDTHGVRRYVELNKVSSAGQNTVNQEMLNAALVSICGLEEQKLIVQLLDEKFSEVDQLDQTLTTALNQADALRQSILKKAFSGKLVPQDPTDEPAAELLARIKAEQSATPKAKKARK